MNTERIERLEQLADELASMDAATVAVTEDYRLALDAQRRELTRLVARMKAAREILSDPTLKQYPVGTHVGKVLSNLRALLADDASEAVA